jgi:undecaprenyl-diphosphatase
MGVICGVLLSRRARSVMPAVAVIGTVASAVLAETALKAVVGQPQTRVELRLLAHNFAPADHSFPSGHVTGTAALLGIIAVCVGMERSPTARAWLAGLVVAGVLAVAVNRVYLAAHWLADIIGGAVLTALFETLGASVISAPSRLFRQGRVVVVVYRFDDPRRCSVARALAHLVPRRKLLVVVACLNSTKSPWAQ